ncbi:BRO-N domain-containing protein, partial [Helicobacter rodentium]
MQLQMFKNENLGQVRVLGNNENPLFCLSDVCKILEIQDTYKVKESILKEFELSTLEVDSFDTGFGVKQFTMITEPQLYFVLMRSDKPKAKPFRQWVVNEVL